MLTKNDLLAIEKLLEPKFNKIDGKFNKIDGEFIKIDGKFNKIDGEFGKIHLEFKKNEERHEELQNSINVLVDTIGEDVYGLKDRTTKIERHLGFGVAA
ncbi:MAG: hypothetical protein AAB506_03165 [Patescibacteria group bacterium]